MNRQVKSWKKVILSKGFKKNPQSPQDVTLTLSDTSDSLCTHCVQWFHQGDEIMAKNYRKQGNSSKAMKYMIRADIKVNGTVQRKDIIGAIMGHPHSCLISSMSDVRIWQGIYPGQQIGRKIFRSTHAGAATRLLKWPDQPWQSVQLMCCETWRQSITNLATTTFTLWLQLRHICI